MLYIYTVINNQQLKTNNMKAASYNKSEIMRNAHRIYNRSWNMTFSEALKQAWKIAKDNKAMMEASAKASTERASKNGFYNRFDKKMSCQYKNVTFGKNDWAADYRRF